MRLEPPKLLEEFSVTHLLLTVALQVSALSTGALTYRDAYYRAEQTGQPLVVLVGADWCPACQTMKHSVVPQLARQGILQQVAFATVNTDHEQALAGQLMTGDSIPQLVMYRKTAKGWKRQHLTGAQSAGTITTFLSQGAPRPSTPPANNLTRAN